MENLGIIRSTKVSGSAPQIKERRIDSRIVNARSKLRNFLEVGFTDIQTFLSTLEFKITNFDYRYIITKNLSIDIYNVQNMLIRFKSLIKKYNNRLPRIIIDNISGNIIDIVINNSKFYNQESDNVNIEDTDQMDSFKNTMNIFKNNYIDKYTEKYDVYRTQDSDVNHYFAQIDELYNQYNDQFNTIFDNIKKIYDLITRYYIQIATYTVTKITSEYIEKISPLLITYSNLNPNATIDVQKIAPTINQLNILLNELKAIKEIILGFTTKTTLNNDIFKTQTNPLINEIIKLERQYTEITTDKISKFNEKIKKNAKKINTLKSDITTNFKKTMDDLTLKTTSLIGTLTSNDIKALKNVVSELLKRSNPNIIKHIKNVGSTKIQSLFRGMQGRKTAELQAVEKARVAAELRAIRDNKKNRMNRKEFMKDNKVLLGIGQNKKKGIIDRINLNNDNKFKVFEGNSPTSTSWSKNKIFQNFNN